MNALLMELSAMLESLGSIETLSRGVVIAVQSVAARLQTTPFAVDLLISLDDVLLALLVLR